HEGIGASYRQRDRWGFVGAFFEPDGVEGDDCRSGEIRGGMFTCQLRPDLSESHSATRRAGSGATDIDGDAVEEFAFLHQAEIGPGAVGMDVEFCAAVQ